MDASTRENVVDADHDNEDDDPVKHYLESLYKSAKESSWATFLLDKSQAVVFSSILALIIAFLWLVSMFGMWSWQVGNTETVGITVFCASFSFSNIMNCHILPGEALVCPPEFQNPVCVNWYENALQHEDVSPIYAMQALTIAGTCVGALCSALGLVTWTMVSDQAVFQRSMKAGSVLMVINALLSLADFIVYMYFPYIQKLHAGQGCILLPDPSGLKCEPTSALVPPLGSGYAFTATVVIFAFSVINALFYWMGSLREHYDFDKDA